MSGLDSNSLTVECPAKVNLALSVGPTQQDGFHPIASWMVAVELADRLTLRRGDEQGCELHLAFADDAPVTQPVDWPVERDLAWRAHDLLQREIDRDLPAQAQLVKCIPTGAGLGGGSSDAAGMLVGLNRLYGLNLQRDRLMQIGARLGSDVPFLVAAMHDVNSALATGRGERIEPMPLREPIHLTLVLPPFSCPTAPVYAAFDELGGAGDVDEPAVRRLAETGVIGSHTLFNDLADAAAHAQPKLAQLRSELAHLLQRPIHVTGSGSAMFINADSPDDARHTATRIQDELHTTAIATRTLGPDTGTP